MSGHVVIVRNPTQAWMRSFRSFEDHLHIDVIAIVVGSTCSPAERVWPRKTSDMFDAAMRMPERYPEYDKILCLPSRPVTSPISALFEIMKPGAINVFFDDRSAWGIVASDHESIAACRERKTFDPVRFDVFGTVPRLEIDSKCVTLYVNHHDDASEDVARRDFRDWPFVSHVRMPTTPILENVQYCSDLLLSRKREWENQAFVGTIAYSAMRKLWFQDPIDFSTVPASTDVIALYPGDDRRRRRIDLIKHGEAMHPGFERVWTLVMDTLDVPEAFRNPEPFFSNYFMMAPAHFERFCAFMRRTWDAVQENDATYEALYRESASYVGRMTTKMLMDMYGVPRYPFFTFVFERLCPVFCAMEGLEVHFYFRPANLDI